MLDSTRVRKEDLHAAPGVHQVRCIVVRVYRYRVYPTRAQDAALRETLERLRELYNAAPGMGKQGGVAASHAS